MLGHGPFWYHSPPGSRGGAVALSPGGGPSGLQLDVHCRQEPPALTAPLMAASLQDAGGGDHWWHNCNSGKKRHQRLVCMCARARVCVSACTCICVRMCMSERARGASTAVALVPHPQAVPPAATVC